ncbi:MAG: hypothetical protein ABEJ87_00490 [Candidatus Nanohalobium sp.]
MPSPKEFPEYITEEKASEWSFYRPILCQFITSEKIPDDAYRAEQVQDVFPHGDTYMPDTGMKAKNDRFPDPVWDSRTEFEAYVRNLGEFDILDYEELSFEDEELDDEIISISRAEGLESRDIYLLISETDDLVKALEQEAV